MDRTQNRSLEDLDTLELELLLREELAKEQKNILLIQQILEKLKAQCPNLPEVTQEEADEVQLRLQESRKVPPAPKRPRIWQKRFAVAAAVLCLMILLLPVASGASWLQQIIAKWNDKFFWIEFPGNPVEPPEDYVFETDNPGLQQLYDAVTELGITQPVVPMWLPEGFDLTSLEVRADEGEAVIFAALKNEGTEIVFFLERREYNIERHKDFENPEMWKYIGINHYYIENYNGSKVIWANGDWEIMISTSLDKSEMRSIVNSIYYGKEG